MANEIKASIDELMKQAKVMQDNMQEAQQSLAALEVTGKSHAGLVEITLDGRHYPKAVKLSSFFADEDPDAMEDLILEALKNAVKKIEDVTKQKMLELTSKLGLPNDLQLPFQDK